MDKHPCHRCPHDVEFNNRAGVWVHSKTQVRQCGDDPLSVALPAPPRTRTRVTPQWARDRGTR